MTGMRGAQLLLMGACTRLRHPVRMPGVVRLLADEIADSFPALADSIADWLEYEADELTEADRRACAAAVAVARTLLGQREGS